MSKKKRPVFLLAVLGLTVGFFAVRGGSEEKVLEILRAGGTEVLPASLPAAETAETGFFPVNINTADEAQLELLPGIGPVKAAAIVADREARGSFLLPEDIMRVSGIKEGTFGKLKAYITVGPRLPEQSPAAPGDAAARKPAAPRQELR